MPIYSLRRTPDLKLLKSSNLYASVRNGMISHNLIELQNFHHAAIYKIICYNAVAYNNTKGDGNLIVSRSSRNNLEALLKCYLIRDIADMHGT